MLRVRLEADFTGTGTWSLVKQLEVKNGAPLEHKFSDAFTAYWVRLVPDGDATVSAEFIYE